MPDAFLAPSLARLRTSVDLRWPGRDRSSDGWIGDKAHQATQSDHNPASSGVVRAIDLDKDGLHVPTVLAALMLHPSIRYIIHNKRIYHVDSRMKPRKYTGTNPHTGHIHGSIHHTKTAETSKVAWRPISSTFRWPVMRSGDAGRTVGQLQAILNGFGAVLALDGQFGPATLAAVRSFQSAKKLSIDGVCGPQTSLALRTR